MPEKTASAPKSTPKIHYRLTLDEWLKAVDALKPAELKVLYYLRTLDPFGDRKHSIKVRETAHLLKMDPGTVSRALKALDQKGWIDLDLIEVSVRVKTKAIPPSSTEPERAGVVSAQHVASGSEALSQDQKCCVQTTNVVSGSGELCTDNTQPLKALSDSVSRSPHTLKTLNTDQTQRKERENRKLILEKKLAEKGVAVDAGSVHSLERKFGLEEIDPDWDTFSAADDPAFFDFVLSHRVPKLPQQPASPQCVAEGWIRKSGTRLYAEYQSWLAIEQQRQKRLDDSPSPPEPLQPSVWQLPQPELTREDVLGRLRGAIAARQPISQLLWTKAEQFQIDIARLQANPAEVLEGTETMLKLAG